MKTDIRRYLAADSETRRLKLTTETRTPQSSVQTDNQQDPPSGRFGRHTRDPGSSDRFEEKTFGDIWQQTVAPAEAHHRAQPRQTSAELSLERHSAEQTILNLEGKATDRKPPDFSKRFLKLNKLSVPNQRRSKRTPYAGTELGKFDLAQHKP